MEKKKEVNNLDILNDVIRTRILCIEADLLKIRQAIIEYEKSRIEKK